MGIRLSRKIRWMVVGVYILFLYAGLYLVPLFARLLEEAGLLSGFPIAVFAAFLLALWVAYHFFFRVREFKAYIFLLVISLFYLIALYSMVDPISKIHLIEYSILSCLLLAACKIDLCGLKLYALSILILFIVGVVDELVQIFIPQRVFDVNDIFENTLGGYLGAAIFWLIEKYRAVA